MIKKILLWIAVIGMSIIIFGFSANNGEKSSGMSENITEKTMSVVEKVVTIEEAEREDIFNDLHYIVRKSGHFSEFALLSILVFCLAKSYNISNGKSVLIALSYCLAFAISDEVHQLFVEGRDGRVLDVLIDFSGSCAGAGVCCLIVKIKKSIKQKYS